MIKLYYTDRFDRYDLGPDHPMRPARFELAYQLMAESGILDFHDVEQVEPVHASEVELLKVHTKDYIEAVKAQKANLHFGIGDEDTPAFQGMYEASSLLAGASIQAAESIQAPGDKALSIAGGLHHALPARAAGFCVFNDPALAIAALRQRFDRVLYLDVDAHHGDGVQEIFYRDPSVLTVSLHESGKYLYPGTGFIEEVGRGPGRGYSVNVPLPRLSGDIIYRRAFEEIVPPLFRWFMPQAVVAQIGVDTHYSDPLTSLRLTLDGYNWVVRRIVQLTDEFSEGRLLALGGGGYSLSVVPVAWTCALQIMRHLDLQALPCRWVELLENSAGIMPLDLYDCKAPGKLEGSEDDLEEALSGLKTILSSIHGTFSF
jgi:acetoin utilization protein AcuC